MIWGYPYFRKPLFVEFWCNRMVTQLSMSKPVLRKVGFSGNGGACRESFICRWDVSTGLLVSVSKVETRMSRNMVWLYLHCHLHLVISYVPGWFP